MGKAMKVSISRGRDIQEQVAFVLEAEKLGVDAVCSVEAWGEDAVVL